MRSVALKRPVALVCFSEGRPFLPELASELARYGEVYRFNLERGQLFHNERLVAEATQAERHLTALHTLWTHRGVLREAVVHYHFIHPVYAFAEALAPHGRKIAQFWGSDLYRIGRVRAQLLQPLLRSAAIVACTSARTRDVLVRRYGRGDVRVLHFGLRSFDALAARLALGPRIQKDTICIGYNGFREQNHLRIIAALAPALRRLGDRYRVVIPFTYGGSDEYAAELTAALTGASLTGVEVSRAYLPFEDLLDLRLRTAVMLHLPVSDAFSASMQETLLTGGTVIAGDWLEYREIDELEVALQYVGWESLASEFVHAIARHDQVATLKTALLTISGWEACIDGFMDAYGSLVD